MSYRTREILCAVCTGLAALLVGAALLSVILTVWGVFGYDEGYKVFVTAAIAAIMFTVGGVLAA